MSHRGRQLSHLCGFVSLQQFSIDIAKNASNVCLAHLFTYQDFDEGTLGLAYVAPSKPDIPGGLCSKGDPLTQHSSETGRHETESNSCVFCLQPVRHLPTKNERST